MLPDFPRLKRDIQKRLLDALQNTIEKQAPLTAEISVHRQIEGHEHEHEIGQGKSKKGRFKEIASQFSIPANISSTETAEQVMLNLRAMASDIAKQYEGMLFSTLHDVTRETGNTLDARGKPFHLSLVLDMLERVWIDFDEKGNPILPTIVLHPDMMKRIEGKLAEWESDPELQARRKNILAKKKEEWRDRESNRKLVG